MCENRAVVFSAAGLDLGIQLEAARFWARAGLVHHRVVVSWVTEGRRTAATSPTTGFDTALGAAIPLSSRIRLSPGVRWSGLSMRFPEDPGSDRLRALIADVGVRYRIR